MHTSRASEKIIYDDVARVAAVADLTPLKGKNILITGANGLIGAYFAYLLHYLNQERGYGMQVDLITKSPVDKKSRIYGLKDAEHFTIIQRDLAEPLRYTKHYDYIMYGAGYGAPSMFLRDPLNVMDVNYVGFKSVLESYLTINPKVKILYLSSSEIYGSPPPEAFPTVETYPGNSDVTNNRACYVESKRLAEVLALTYHSLHGMNITIARPAFPYGPGMTFDDQRVISQFMRKAYYDKVITMIDDGRDLRSFCYISDALRQLVNILLYANDVIYNVGSSDEEVSIKDLATMIADIIPSKVVVGRGKTDAVAGASTRVCVDTRKLQFEFNFKPEVSLKEGLTRMVEWNLALLAEQ